MKLPPETRTRGLIVSSVCFQMANVLNALASYVTPELFPTMVHAALYIVGAFGLILFTFFMKRVAVVVGRDNLADQAKEVLILCGLLLTATLIMALLIFSGATLAGIMTLPILIAALMAFVMYAKLTTRLRKAICD